MRFIAYIRGKIFALKNLRLVFIGRRWRATLTPRIKLNRETKNFSLCACDLRLVETSFYLCDFSQSYIFNQFPEVITIKRDQSTTTNQLQNKLFRSIQLTFKATPEREIM